MSPTFKIKLKFGRVIIINKVDLVISILFIAMWVAIWIMAE